MLFVALTLAGTVVKFPEDFSQAVMFQGSTITTAFTPPTWRANSDILSSDVTAKPAGGEWLNTPTMYTLPPATSATVLRVDAI
ncbi:hypothetical protein P186_1502 [Pyrobaculum ferrireducens]|uniref:Uncharacterized protein n=1 Tax=Pyrobaculum ferrireducens TaxID=1104324 RepID=G7VFB7_9CREN|nr:hypothetical protein P186_1502 [Pyrobaculum ferrireducens]